MKLINKSNTDYTVVLHNGKYLKLLSLTEYILPPLTNLQASFYKCYEELGIFVVSNNTPITVEKAIEEQHSPEMESVVNIEENSTEGVVEVVEDETEVVETEEETNEVENDTNETTVDVVEENTDYSGKTLTKLKKIADKKAIEYPQNVTKKQLIELLNGGN